MAALTIEGFKRIVRSTVGVDDSVDLDGNIEDVPFSDLGYDSLAVLEISNKIRKEHGLDIPEDVITDLRTPRMMIDYVNGAGLVG